VVRRDGKRWFLRRKFGLLDKWRLPVLGLCGIGGLGFCLFALHSAVLPRRVAGTWFICIARCLFLHSSCFLWHGKSSWGLGGIVDDLDYGWIFAWTADEHICLHDSTLQSSPATLKEKLGVQQD